MKKFLIIFFVILSGSAISAQSNYIVNEKDSTLKLKEPLQLKVAEEFNSLFSIRLKEKIKNHVWFFSFSITNNTTEDLSLRLGSEGHLEVVTSAVVIKAGATEVIKYKMRKVQDWAGFTQVGKIIVYSKTTGSTDFNLYRNDLSGDFSISGEWVY